MNIARFLFSFEGRIKRRPFWVFTIAAILGIYFGGELIAWTTGVPLRAGVDLAALILLLPALAVQAKRWHDRDKSAWWILINLVPIIGPVWALIECGALDGTPGPNAHGDDPLGRTVPPRPAAESHDAA